MADRHYVYIMTDKSGTLYVGMTNDLKKRVYQHKQKMVEGFTKKYNITRLLYYETFDDTLSAIRAERKIKGWLREKKIKLIESKNPGWTDLSEDW